MDSVEGIGLCRAVMGLPRWKRTGGRDFVFYHSHPGFEWDDLDVTTAYQDTICNDFQARPVRPIRKFISCIFTGRQQANQREVQRCASSLALK